MEKAENLRWLHVTFLLALVGALLLLVALPGCADDDDDSSSDDDNNDDNDNQSDDDDDDQTDDDTVDDDLPQYFNDRPELTDWSLWRSVYDAAQPRAPRLFGGFGLGNGKVFSLVAARPPLSTLHNIAGPVYQKHTKFFSDKSFSLFENTREKKWRFQRAFRVRDTAITVTEADTSNLSMWTVDFAPRGQGVDGTVAAKTLIRTIVIHNRGVDTVSSLYLKAETALGTIRDGLMRETTLPEFGHLTAGFLPGDFSVASSKKALTVAVPDIQPGGQFVCRFVIAFETGTDAESNFRAAAELDPEILLETTIESWQAMTDFGSRITTSNQRFDDLIEGLAQTMAVQQAEGGCFAQMSEYGYNALRDMYGIARFFPLIGRTEEYGAMLDYVWQAVLKNGDIRADVEIDLEFDDQPPEPDWENLPTFGGRMRAESPSYLILMYREYVRATGDWQPVRERYGMLRHALIHQDFREGCLLPFSDDETFRIAMMAAFGHSVFQGYEEKFLSANSSFLFVVAATFLQEAAAQLGYSDDADQYEQMADEVRQCTEQYYWREDGYYTPIVNINTLEPDTRPFEDVNTKPLWLGYLTPVDEKAESNILALIDRLESKDGLLYSPIDPRHGYLGALLKVHEGFVTGMAPGFQLDNLSRLDHPLAEESFLLYDRFFQDSGNVSEGHVVDDFGRLVYLYEPFGLLSDLTARFRSWEGSINGAAMIQYLFGLEIDVPDARVAIAPHLPGGWSFAQMEQARAGDVRFDILVEDDDQVRRVVLDNATGALTVDAVVSLDGTIDSVTVNGSLVNPTIENQWGRSRALLPGLALSAQQTLTIEVRR